MFRKLPAQRCQILASLVLVFTFIWHPARAECPFNADQQGASAGTATTDGLLFIRFALGLNGPGLTLGATQGNVQAPAVLAHIADYYNYYAADIDGNGQLTPFDGAVISRWLFGFRGAALGEGLEPLEFSKRYGGEAFDRYITNGCTGLNDLPDPRIVVWNAMNSALVAGNATTAKTYLTANALTNHGPALDALLAYMPTIVASYSTLTAKIVDKGYAEYIVTRPLPGSATGEKEVYFVTFLQDEAGNWFIDSM